MNSKKLAEIKELYNKIKPDIDKQINKFKTIWKTGSELDIFIELIFCIMTPQSKAIMADKVINNIRHKDLLFSNDHEALSNELRFVRFKNNKAKYIIEAVNLLRKNNKISIKDKINTEDLKSTRDWFVKNIKGIGYKEASHFLRNIGFVENIAILDRHILKNLFQLDVIEKIPVSISPKLYCELEKKLIDYSDSILIPAGHMDFVLWYKETGFIFK
jgi:N-glycosylase/DNA lyase